MMKHDKVGQSMTKHDGFHTNRGLTGMLDSVKYLIQAHWDDVHTGTMCTLG